HDPRCLAAGEKPIRQSRGEPPDPVVRDEGWFARQSVDSGTSHEKGPLRDDADAAIQPTAAPTPSRPDRSWPGQRRRPEPLDSRRPKLDLRRLRRNPRRDAGDRTADGAG